MDHTAMLVTIGRVPFRCQVCSSELFFSRDTSINNRRAERQGVTYHNERATGLVCAQCGYVHLFLNNAIEFWKPEGGYPQP